MAADDKTINYSLFSPRLTPPFRSPARLRLGDSFFLPKRPKKGILRWLFDEREKRETFFFSSLKCFVFESRK